MIDIKELRVRLRQRVAQQWACAGITSDDVSASYLANELGGECGELQNVVKKLERERLGMRGSRATRQQLGEELADVVICAQKVADHYGVYLEVEIPAKFNKTTAALGLDVFMEPHEASDEASDEPILDDDHGGPFPAPPDDDLVLPTLEDPDDSDVLVTVLEAMDKDVAFDIVAAWVAAHGRLFQMQRFIRDTVGEGGT